MYPQEATHVDPAATDLKAGYVVFANGTTTSLVSGGANQAACQQLPVTGITLSNTDSGDLPSIAIAGGEIAFVAAGSVAIGDLLVAKFGTGALMKVGTHVSGDVIVGVCTMAAASGATGRCRFVGHPTK